MIRVFLSHNSADKPFVRLLAEEIRASKVDVWLDELKIEVGDSLLQKVSEGIAASRYIVAFLSHHSLKSEWVKRELAIANTRGVNGKGIFVLPVLLDDLQPENLPNELQDLLYLDFRRPGNYDQSLRLLLHKLNPTFNSENCFQIDAFRKDFLVTVGKGQMMDWIVEYLHNAVRTRKDPSDRYWSYIALGELGTSAAAKILETASAEETEPFAKMGVEEALSQLSHLTDSTHPPKRPSL